MVQAAASRAGRPCPHPVAPAGFVPHRPTPPVLPFPLASLVRMLQAEGTTRAKAQTFGWQKKDQCAWTILNGGIRGGQSQTSLGLGGCIRNSGLELKCHSKSLKYIKVVFLKLPLAALCLEAMGMRPQGPGPLSAWTEPP